METIKLYYEDSHLAVFTARVLECTACPQGYAVILDATAFYPEGGGQAADTGTLDGIRVTDTQEQDGRIVHLCDGALEKGREVSGCIDWEKRFSRMQQHSGEHIVSGIIHRRWGFHNVGFHMGSGMTEIDFDGVIPPQELPKIEREANEAVWKNLPLHIRTPQPEELASIPYRTKRALPWPVRIVEVPGYDICACCGTHVSASGEIGFVKLFSAVPCRGGTRIEMACGGEALDSLNRFFAQNRTVSQLLSVPQTQTAEGTKAILTQLEQTKFTLGQLRREQWTAIAESYRGAGDVVHFAKGLDGTGLRELTDKIGKVCGGRACVFSDNGSTFGYALASGTENMQPLCRALNAAFAGRGGGKPNFCQGSLTGTQAAIAAFLAEGGAFR